MESQNRVAHRGLSGNGPFPSAGFPVSPPAAVTAVAAAAALLLAGFAPGARIRAQTGVGLGSYATEGAFAVPAGKPFVTDDFAQKHVSAQWWSTLITKPYSDPLYAHPASFRATVEGMEMGYPGSPNLADGGGFSASHAADLTVGIEGMDAEAARLQGGLPDAAIPEVRAFWVV